MFELTCPSKHYSLTSAVTAPDARGESEREEKDFPAWIRDHESELYRFALHRVRDCQLAEDLVQDSLLAGWQALQRFNGQSKVSTWLFSILRNKITDHFRRSRAVKFASEMPSEDLDAAKQESSSDDLFGSSLEREEFWSQLNQCLDRMPSKLAIAFRLREIDGQTTTETCGHLHISPTNLSMRLHRARIVLQRHMKPEWASSLRR